MCELLREGAVKVNHTFVELSGENCQSLSLKSQFESYFLAQERWQKCNPAEIFGSSDVCTSDRRDTRPCTLSKSSDGIYNVTTKRYYALR